MHAGMALAERGLFLAHAMAQALGGRYGASHGGLNALCLAPALRFNEAVVPDAISALAGAMGATDAPSRIEELARLGGFERLRDLEYPGGRPRGRGSSECRAARRARPTLVRRRPRTSRRSCARSGEPVDESTPRADHVCMAVEYAGILAAVSLMAITLTGAYGKNVTAVFNSSERRHRRGGEGGEGAEGRAGRREGRLQACAVREAGVEVPLRARLDRRHEERRASAASRCSARVPRRSRLRARCAGTAKLVAQLKKRGISVSAAANAVTKGVVSACA